MDDTATRLHLAYEAAVTATVVPGQVPRPPSGLALEPAAKRFAATLGAIDIPPLGRVVTTAASWTERFFALRTLAELSEHDAALDEFEKLLIVLGHATPIYHAALSLPPDKLRALCRRALRVPPRMHDAGYWHAMHLLAIVGDDESVTDLARVRDGQAWTEEAKERIHTRTAELEQRLREKDIAKRSARRDQELAFQKGLFCTGGRLEDTEHWMRTAAELKRAGVQFTPSFLVAKLQIPVTFEDRTADLAKALLVVMYGQDPTPAP